MDEDEIERRVRARLREEQAELQRQQSDKDRMLVAGLIMIAIWFIIYLWHESK